MAAPSMRIGVSRQLLAAYIALSVRQSGSVAVSTSLPVGIQATNLDGHRLAELHARDARNIGVNPQSAAPSRPPGLQIHRWGSAHEHRGRTDDPDLHDGS